MNLTKMFEAQHQLALKFAPNERVNGYAPPTEFPLDLALRASQDRLRAFAWYITEEVVEAQSAPSENYIEELSDALHFAIELCLLAGTTPEYISALEANEGYEELMLPSQLYMVIIHVGLAMNQCKAKPWKLKPKTPDVDYVRYHLAKAVLTVVSLLRQADIDPEKAYFMKEKINQQRIKDQV